VHLLRFEHAVKTLCRVLNVNRSTYYKHFKQGESKREIENQGIRRAILELYGKAKQRFGIVKIQKRLEVEYGIKISAGRVSRLMKRMNLPKMSTVKPFVGKKKADCGSDCPNHVNKRFNPGAPNRVWVSDITYVKAAGGWHYVCVVIDLYARKLIAHKLSRKADAKLVIATFLAAYLARGRPVGVIFHSDRGVQYTSGAFRKILDESNVTQSFSAKGYPYDNAVAESFFKFLKLEETDRKMYNSFEALDMALFEYARFYNNSRPHSHNDGLTPNQQELPGEV
jgi:transposase InsO family protein